jgi:polyisoprenoid-binding protein YceI
MHRLAVLLALAFAAPALAEPVRYTLDGRHSNVRFSYDYGGLAAQVVAMHGPSAELTFDADDPAAIRLAAEVPVTGVSTGLPGFDTKFASAEYFDAGKAPQVRFTSVAVRRIGEGRYEVDGLLALRGIERPSP